MKGEKSSQGVKRVRKVCHLVGQNDGRDMEAGSLCVTLASRQSTSPHRAQPRKGISVLDLIST